MEPASAAAHAKPVYWDPADLRREMDRVLDVCHGCRRCWNLCPSFGNVFKRIDALDDQLNAAPAPTPAPPEESSAGAGVGAHAAAMDPALLSAQDPVKALSESDHRRLVDECYQCKLCYNHCPYHPPHRFLLDFPRLMQRAKAVRVKREGASLFERIAARVDWVGAASSWVAPLANWANGWAPARFFLEKALGVHRKRKLPLFHFNTFKRWWARRGPKAGVSGQVVLFYTCSVNYNDPEVGKAAVAVLEKNGLEVLCPVSTCCGMPHLDAGDVDSAVAAARANVARLLPFARRGVPILALGPACSLMLKHEYPALLDEEDARLVARQTYDISEYLVNLKKEGKLNLEFQDEPRSITYHMPCHLKAQNMGYRTKEILELIPGLSLRMIERCSAHDGTWSMKKDYFEMSLEAGKKLFDAVKESPAAAVTDCPLAGIQIAQGAGKSAKHPIQIVAQAYGLSAD